VQLLFRHPEDAADLAPREAGCASRQNCGVVPRYRTGQRVTGLAEFPPAASDEQFGHDRVWGLVGIVLVVEAVRVVEVVGLFGVVASDRIGGVQHDAELCRGAGANLGQVGVVRPPWSWSGHGRSIRRRADSMAAESVIIR
jgi:hypothetical protein